MPEAFIYDAVRTPRGRGSSSGALYEVKPIELLSACLKAIKQRNDFELSHIEDLLVGCTTPVNGQGYNIAKVALLFAGWPDTVSGMQLNRFSASGLDAVNFASAKINAGWEDLLLAGGLESISRIPFGTDKGPLRLDPDVIGKVGYIPPSVAADLLASWKGITRKDLDRYALHSHQRAKNAWEKGLFNKSIISLPDRNGLMILDKDELVNGDLTDEDLSEKKPINQTLDGAGFDQMALQRYPQIERLQHNHTSLNSATFADGAALVLLGTEEKGKQLELKPRARIKTISNASQDPTVMFTGGIAAVKKVLTKTGLQVEDIDLWEIHEEFAASAICFQQHFNIAEDIVNVNGGAIAMGNPPGAIGTILLGKLLDELERRDLQIGCVAVSTYAGMGTVAIIERV